MQIEAIDHFVLTVRDVEATCAFYHRVVGMEVITFGEGRKALAFGNHKINLHQAGHEFEPKADCPTPGAADFCLITHTPIDEVIAQVTAQHIPIIEGPVKRTGAVGPILSIYLRDPDQNLVEIACYME